MWKIQEYIKIKLNDEQFSAAMHISTSSLIIAGAGSGKTRALTYKIAYLILGENIKPLQILAVTFTNKAASEMKERLLKLYDEMCNLSDNNCNALVASDLKWIGTFHGIFLKILKDEMENAKVILDKEFTWNRYTKDFTILDPNDTTSIIKDVLKRNDLKDAFKPNECKWFISKQKNQWITPRTYMRWEWMSSDYDNSMWKVYEEYQKILSLSNALDFDDLLLFPYLIFSREKSILKKWVDTFQYIMVDEAQDTNWIQFELMKMLSWEGWNITLIWDDYQSIYGWRGAIMENFLNVNKYWPDMKMFKLQINYRSRPHIVEAGSHIIKNNKNQYEKVIKAHRQGDDKIVLFSHRDDRDEAANIIDFIRKMKGDKIKDWSEVAILYRTNAQSSSFEQILVQEGIPYKIWGAFKFFERKEIKNILAYITYILNPQSNVSLKRIINTPARKIWKTTIGHLEDASILNNLSLSEVMNNSDKLGIKVTPTAKRWIAEFKSVIAAVTTNFDVLTPADVIETLIKTMKYREYLIKEEWSETKWLERYENIWQLMNMAEKYEWTGIEILRQFMDEVALLSDVSEKEKWDPDAIKLMSLHASKWLEFPIVFIVWLEDQVLPLAWAMMEPHLMEEERRLMYVGITRAENHLFLSYANSRMQRWQVRMNPPSRFINELPEDLLKRYDLWWGRSMWWSEVSYNFEAEDRVRHKLFWEWLILETWTDLAVVKFDNNKFGVRKIEMRFLKVM